MEPKITVVVPTRERCDTLQHTLRTCTHQDYDNLIILVSDNYSQDETKEVVSACRDPRIKYINTGRRISMSHNWEFALSHINDGYVLYLGDDDALLLESIKSLARIVADTGSEAICWNQANYIWPDTSRQEANTLIIPLRNSLVRQQSDKMLQLAIEFKIHYSKLPWLYKGLVSFGAIQRAKSASGRFFNSINPDIYSGIAIAAVINEYYYYERPYSINGASWHSIGTSNFSGSADNFSPSKLFLSEENIPFHDKLVIVASIPVLVAESFLQFKDHCQRKNGLPEIDYEKLIFEAMKNVANSPPHLYEPVVAAIIEIGDRNGLSDIARNAIAKYKNVPSNNRKIIHGYNFINQTLSIDCESLGITDVYEAARLCSHVLKIKKEYFSSNTIFKKTIKAVWNKISANIKNYL